MSIKYRLCLAVFLSIVTLATVADDSRVPGKVVANGVVPDEASRAAILERLRVLYGATNVVDRLEVGGVVPPPNWSANMAKILGEDIKKIRAGSIQVTGTRIALSGKVNNEAQRQLIASNMATALNATYVIDNALIASEDEIQEVLDTTLADRVVEFESGSATLTPQGRSILDEMFAAIQKVGTPKVQVIGHTDSQGQHHMNVSLSLARANVVKNYLVSRGIPAQTLSVAGAGPDQPIASNDTPEGRARNRRIEFKLVQ